MHVFIARIDLFFVASCKMTFDVKFICRKFSMSARHAERRDSRSYQVVHETKFGKYSFNGVDPALDPGPKRPFNFFGQFSEVQQSLSPLF